MYNYRAVQSVDGGHGMIRRLAGWRAPTRAFHSEGLKYRAQPASAFCAGGNRLHQHAFIGIQRQALTRAGNGGIDQLAGNDG